MSVDDAIPTIVAIADRPDLAPIVAEWLFHAFGAEDGQTLQHEQDVVAGATARRGVPQCFVLLANGNPVGTASLVADDLDARPDLTPWLASVFVAPAWRARGFAPLLVARVERAARDAAVATLWLYTNTAERIYARAGWRTVERFDHRGKDTALMRRDLTSL